MTNLLKHFVYCLKSTAQNIATVVCTAMAVLRKMSHGCACLF